jgi:uncharacterized protein (TIGR03435 family)
MSARSLAVLVLFSVAADAQPPALLHFDSASIRPVPGSGGFNWGDYKTIDGLTSGERLSDGTLLLSLVSMRTLLKLAYPEILDDQFLKAPGWIRTKGFELIAKAPPGTPADDVRRMIQSLLIERFHLAVHREFKNQKKATLIVAKGGVKLRPADGTADAQCHEKATGWSVQLIQWTCENVTMAFLAETLSVFDATGLHGSYDLAFRWQRPGWGVDGGTVGDPQKAMSYGLEKALGLKLETRGQSIPVIVIDHLNSH